MRFSSFSLGVVVVLLLAGHVFASGKKILIIHSYHPSLSWTMQYTHGIRDFLGATVQLDHFYLDTKRIPASQFKARVEAALAYYRQIQPDLVMLGDDNALFLLWEPIATKGTPVVFFGINSNLRHYFDAIPP